MLMLGIFFQSLLVGYSGAIMPGSLLTYTINKSLHHGAKSGLLISIGHALLELGLVILILLGAGKYMSTEIAKTAIGIAGGLVLGFMGFTMLKEVWTNRLQLNTAANIPDSTGNMLIGGAVVSASNPYFIIWWSAIGLALIMSSYNTFGILGVVIFYLGHITSDITWYSFVSTVVGRTRKLINLKLYKAVIVLLALFLISIGISFFAGSVNSIISAI